MNQILLYLLQVNVTLAALYIVYKLLLAKDTFFYLRRFTLLFIITIAFALPFLPSVLSMFATSSETSNTDLIYTIMLPAIEVVSNAKGTFDVLSTIFILYIIGVLILLYRTVTSLYSLKNILRKTPKKEINEVEIHLLPKGMHAFSFLNWICLPENDFSSTHIKEILTHEQTHVRQYHTIDVLLVQFIVILCWFNPFIWLLRREIRLNHEFLADETVINAGSDKKSYQYLMLHTVYPTMAAANLYNNFNVLPLKRRIMMLNKPRTHLVAIGKYLLLLPAFALLSTLVNCTSTNNDEAVTTNGSYLEEIVAVGYNLEGVTPQEDKGPEYKSDEVYNSVETMPEFPGGTQEMMKYIAQNLKYPVIAQEGGKQGRVIIQFVVTRTGQVSDVKIGRSVDPSLDAEAIRIVESMPKWKPGEIKGQPVNVKYTLPISFRLQ